MAKRKVTSKAGGERPRTRTPRGANQEDPLPALRRMTRAQLLVVAERALTLVPRAKLPLLLGDVLPPEPAPSMQAAAPLLDRVREFHAAALRGTYYHPFRVNSQNFMERSEGTEAFGAEFDRLTRECVHAAKTVPTTALREAFELLLSLCRLIDEGSDQVVFFADEAGSWQLDVDFRAMLSAYFGCLALGTPGEPFAREVDRCITAFAEHDRARLVAAAVRVGNADQRAAVKGLPAGRKRR